MQHPTFETKYSEPVLIFPPGRVSVQATYKEQTMLKLAGIRGFLLDFLIQHCRMCLTC